MQNAQAKGFRPAVETLEDRVQPSAIPRGFSHAPPPPSNTVPGFRLPAPTTRPPAQFILIPFSFKTLPPVPAQLHAPTFFISPISPSNGSMPLLF